LSIKSVVDNTASPYEFILVDNTENNRGMSGGRNFGASIATGDYIAFIDDDIILLPGWLPACIDAIEQGDKFMSTPVHQQAVGRWELEPVNGYRQNYRTGSNCMVMRRSAFEDVGVFDLFSLPGRDIRYQTGKAGKHYASRVSRKGYTFLITKEPFAIDMGLDRHSYT
jgi:GT2 family glycosyltransferase